MRDLSCGDQIATTTNINLKTCCGIYSAEARERARSVGSMPSRNKEWKMRVVPLMPIRPLTLRSRRPGRSRSKSNAPPATAWSRIWQLSPCPRFQNCKCSFRQRLAGHYRLSAFQFLVIRAMPRDMISVRLFAFSRLDDARTRMQPQKRLPLQAMQLPHKEN